jgi:peptidoglycan/xylan/chitin deacetylase (PgdA/CDA1 family)
MRRMLKEAALVALRSSGIFNISVRSARRRQSLLILCYHGISLQDEHEWRGGLFIPPAQFRARLETLRKYDIRVLDLGEAVERLRRSDLPERSAVITFDDGFVDFHQRAVPLLREFGYPCTLYLTTHYCGLPLPIFGLAVHYMLWRRRGETVDLSSYGCPAETVLSPPTVDLVHDRIVEQGRSLETTGKDDLVRQLAADLRLDYAAILSSRILQIMSEAEVREASHAGMDIQLHSHRHRTPRTRDLFLREIDDNRRRIVELTDQTPAHFCYPSGDYAPEVLPWLRERGVLSATTCHLGLAKPHSEPLLLPRLLDSTAVSSVDIESWLCGIRG